MQLIHLRTYRGTDRAPKGAYKGIYIKKFPF